MNRFVYTLLLFCFQFSIGQSIDFDKINYKGLRYYSTKQEIIKKLGSPKRIYKPNYECGFLSVDEQGVEFYTLDYGSLKFTGNKNEKFILEEINFDENKLLFINYSNYKLNSKTTIADLINIFGKEITNPLRKTKSVHFLIMHSNSDDGIVFHIKNGKLVKMEYWSPC